MKTLIKRTYALPSDVLEEFERHVAPGKRGVAVAQALREWTQEREREALRADIDEGLREMAEIYRETEQEFHPLEEEVDRHFHTK